MNEQLRRELHGTLASNYQQLRHDLQATFSGHQLECEDEKQMVMNFFGVKSLPDPLFVPLGGVPEMFDVIEASGLPVYEKRSRVIENVNGFFDPLLNLVVVLDYEKFGRFSNFMRKRVLVHELTHAVSGKDFGLSMRGDKYQPGDYFAEIMKQGDNPVYGISRPRVGMAFGHYPKNVSYASWGTFLEEGISELVSAAWIKTVLSQGEFPEVTEAFKKFTKGHFNPSAPEDVYFTFTSNKGEKVKISFVFCSLGEGMDFVSKDRSSSAGQAVMEMTIEEPALFDAFKSGKRGEIAGLRQSAALINNLLGPGSYGYLQKQEHGISDHRYFDSRLMYVRNTLDELEALASEKAA